VKDKEGGNSEILLEYGVMFRAAAHVLLRMLQTRENLPLDLSFGNLMKIGSKGSDRLVHSLKIKWGRLMQTMSFQVCGKSSGGVGRARH